MSSQIKSGAAKHKFSPYLSCQRLRSVQDLLKQNEDKLGAAQAVLAVLGIDGRFNEGCREFVNYLTFNFFSARQLELEKAGLEEEDVEDVIFLVRPNSVSVYCGSALYSFLLPYIANWRNLQIYCRAQRQGEERERDTDIEEQYKVKSFISMIEGCSVIGIPFVGSNTMVALNNKEKDCTLSIEKWPLMQSYASTDIGCGKFFSLDYAAIDIRSQLMSLYYQCGSFTLEKIIGSSYPLFVRHWNEALEVINNAAKSKNLMQLKEDQVLEPLQCYYRHGQLSKMAKKTSALHPDRKPCVLFGTHSVEFGKESKPITLKASVKKGNPQPSHMLMQCVSPTGPLLCARTYFFCSRREGNFGKELDALALLYATCIQAATIAVNEFTSSLSGTQAERKANELLLSKGISCGLVFDAKCTVIAYNKLGNKVPISDGVFSPTINVVKVSATNVKSSHGADVIGSIVFSDTFVISSFNAEMREKNSICNVLTSDVPLYVRWQIETADKHFSEEEPLVVCKDMTVCSSSDLYSPPCTASIQFNQDGSMLLSSKNMDDITLKNGVQYFDSPTPGEVCLVVVSFDLPENTQLWRQVPADLRAEISTVPDVVLSTPSKCMVLALLPGTQAYKEFYAVVVQHIQTVPLATLTLRKMKELSVDLSNMYNSIKSSVKSQIPISKRTFSKSAALVSCPSMGDFVAHLTVATVAGDLPVPRFAVECLLNKNPLNHENGKDEERVSVNIVTGFPCSGADDISYQLVSLNKEKVRWVVIRPSLSPDLDCTILKSGLEEQLAQAVTHKRVARPSAAARKRLRIIILAVGFFDVCEIAQCVTHHTDTNVREQLSLGAVTHCIWPKSVYFTEYQNYPKFFDQCLSGVISNFAFITEEQEEAGAMDKTLAGVQRLLRFSNKQAAFLTCPGGKLIRKTDFDLVLAEDNFSSVKMICERFLLRPNLCVGKYVSGRSVPGMSKVVLEFSQPLMKGSFSARLRSLKSSITRPQPVGRVSFVSGCVAFTDSPKQSCDVNFCSAMHEAEIIPRTPQATLPAPPSKGMASKAKPYSLEFHGMNLDDVKLKEWLRKCGRQKPSKKCHKTKNNITRDELQMIQEENSMRHLPEGYFYNGTFYVSLFDSKKMLQHPNIQQFVDDYLKEENAEIDAYNAEIDRQNIKDVFE